MTKIGCVDKKFDFQSDQVPPAFLILPVAAMECPIEDHWFVCTMSPMGWMGRDMTLKAIN